MGFMRTVRNDVRTGNAKVLRAVCIDRTWFSFCQRQLKKCLMAPVLLPVYLVLEGHGIVWKKFRAFFAVTLYLLTVIWLAYVTVRYGPTQLQIFLAHAVRATLYPTVTLMKSLLAPSHILRLMAL